jgi:hypothetical protein
LGGNQFSVACCEEPLVFLLAEPEVIIRKVNICSGSPDGAIGQDGVREHGQDLSRLTIDLASSKDCYSLICDCDRGRSIDRTVNGGHEQDAGHARDDDDSEEDEGQGDRKGEYQHQNCVSSSWIGTDDSNAVFVGIRTRAEELFALSEPL